MALFVPMTGTLIEDLSNICMVGLMLNAVVQLVQKLPWPSSWLQKKPLGCTVCLTWWAGIIMWANTGELNWPSVTFWGANVGMALLLDALFARWRPLPPPGLE